MKFIQQQPESEKNIFYNENCKKTIFEVSEKMLKNTFILTSDPYYFFQ